MGPWLHDILGILVAETNSKGVRSRAPASAWEMRLLWIGQRGESYAKDRRLEKAL